MTPTGLTQAEATARLKQFGPNALTPRSQVVGWKIFLSQFRSPLVYILLLAALATLWLREFADAIVIGIAVMVNAIFGFVQEYRAGRALQALSNLLVPQAKIKRDGVWREIPLNQVVPGDVARLEIGQSVPADGVLISGDSVMINEAILTGESLPVEKHLDSALNFEAVFNPDTWNKLAVDTKVFQGTTVAAGIGEMLVIKTGAATSLGLIAHKVSATREQATPLQLKLQRLSHWLTLILAVIAGLVFVIGLIGGSPLREILPTAIALAVAAVPEGLLVGLTLILSIGMGRILKRKGLVRKLLAAEVLGGVNVICLDKTGTITKGEMKTLGAVTKLALVGEDVSAHLNHTHEQKQLSLVYLAAKLCNDLRDPLELAMEEWASVKGNGEGKKYIRVDSLPFDHRYKYIATRHRHQETGKLLDFISGAPEVCLGLSTLTAKEQQAWLEQFSAIGKVGYRLVAFGYRIPKSASIPLSHKQIGKYHWLGLIVFEDPIRSGVEASLNQAIKAGISLKVITGDYTQTAWAILHRLGLVQAAVDPGNVVTGSELEQLVQKGDHQGISDHIERSILFARVNPEQKLIIVKALQDRGHVVAMTGDGVNDAPALQQADIGIVLSAGSDVAKETADMVLLDNNFATILAAVEEGRAIFANLRRVLLYLMADAFAAIILVSISIIFAWPLPLVAVQILWINLISDGFPYLALTVEPKDPKLLEQKPTPKQAPLLDRNLLILIGVISLTTGILGAALFYYFHFTRAVDLAYTRSVVFAATGAMTLVYVYAVRTLTAGIWRINPLKNPWLILATAVGLLIQLAAIYWPPLMGLFETRAVKLDDWLIIAVAVTGLMVTIETIKFILRRLELVNNHS